MKPVWYKTHTAMANQRGSKPSQCSFRYPGFAVYIGGIQFRFRTGEAFQNRDYSGYRIRPTLYFQINHFKYEIIISKLIVELIHITFFGSLLSRHYGAFLIIILKPNR